MTKNIDRDPTSFLPYLLNMAAEETSARFQAIYKERYGLLRTEWRVLFHLGRFGDMAAREICDRSHIHKTKISRAVAKLEERRFLKRTEVAADRRSAMLNLTKAGISAYTDLDARAQAYDLLLSKAFSAEEQAVLRKCLKRLSSLPDSRSAG